MPIVYDYGGHPAPAGPALPNLINAVLMLKSTSTSKSNDSNPLEDYFQMLHVDQIFPAPCGFLVSDQIL